MNRKKIIKIQKLKPNIPSSNFAQRVMAKPSEWEELALLRRKGNELYQKELLNRKQKEEILKEVRENRLEVEKLISKMTGVKLEELDAI